MDSTISAAPKPSSYRDFLAGGGDMGRRLRDFDWANTPLGQPSRWPQSLKTAIRIMLTSRQPIWVGWGKDLTYFYNDPYKSIIGGKHPSALGQPTSHVWREIWSDISPMLATALSGDEGTYVEQQLLIMERNGYPEETYYTFSYSPIPNDDGTVGGIICANTDDTQRVINERQLSLLRDLAAETANCRTWQEACELSGKALHSDLWDLPFAMIYIAEEAGGKPRLAGTCGIDKSHAAVPQVLDERSPWPVDLTRGHDPIVVSDLRGRFGVGLPSGTWSQSPIQAVVLPIGGTGETGRAGVLIVGLNPFRLFDENYRSFLTLVAGQITATIANAEAYEEERRRVEALAEIDRAKTTFFSNVSHEFRTPLTLMMAPLEDVLGRSNGELSGQSRTLLETAHRNSLRLLKLVNTLLDFTRIEAGRIQASYQATDLAALTAELASNFRSAVEKAGLTLTVRNEPLSAPVYVDGEMWEKIVLNLLSNAFKFTFEGGIEVSCRPSADGRSAEVTIRDTGTGIPENDLPRIFERFMRVEGARGRSFEGSGIGLALVQELVRLHGGSISVESKPDQGSAFTVTVPFGTAHLPAQRVAGARSQSVPGTRAQAYVDEALSWLSDNPSETLLPSSSEPEDLLETSGIEDADRRLVLLADDNADMRQYVERLLKGAGYQVKSFPDGEAALAAARQRKPDLVLSDVMMPKLDGFGLLSAMREDADLRDLPVLLLSARAGEEAKVEGIRSGADDYLTKPFSARELIARVEANLRLSDIRKEASRLMEEEKQTLEKLNRVGTTIAAEIDLERAVQAVTDAATELTGAAFGAFFYNVIRSDGEAYTLYTISGAPREAFSKFPMPRNTAVFAPTFSGEGIVRSDDITVDKRYGHNAPHHGMPAGHLPVRSYLAAPVISQSGAVLGGLFFGHPERGVFDERAERLLAGIAAQAAIAIDKAHLYRAAQNEIERRKQIEVALRENEETLERRVVERTAELQEANERLRTEATERERAEGALRQAQKMEGIGQLTGGIAHDFNNLLTVIIGNLEALQRHIRDPNRGGGSLERSSDLAMRGAQRAAALTQRLLAFSRQQPLDPKPLDVNRLVGNMSDLLRRTIGEQIAVETVLAGGLWMVNVDTNELEVAILNLAVNARDAMPEGGRLTIETANAHLDEGYAALQVEVVPGQYVVIAITDNGIGMSRETLSKAFEPFFTTKEVGHGTGLGLSQVYGFVKQSGGHLKLYSELGAGTTVKIYLPRNLAANAVPDAEASAPLARAGASETILVVEDDADVRAHSTSILRELGYTVLEASDGRSGLQMLERNPHVQLLFTDVGLPGGMNGRQLADAARKARPDLKVLFTTGYARNAIVHDGRLDAGVQLITKPYTYAAIAAKLRDVLDARSASGRILVVEDEPLLQMLAAENLEEIGFKTEVAGSATEALNRMRLMPDGFDAAMIDLGLPDRRGDVLIEELRAIRFGLPIIVVSGQGQSALTTKFKDSARLSVLQKPYTVEQLLAALESLEIKRG